MDPSEQVKRCNCAPRVIIGRPGHGMIACKVYGRIVAHCFDCPFSIIQRPAYIESKKR